MVEPNFYHPQVFSENLFAKLAQINPGIPELELYEFRYALENMVPEKGWKAVTLASREDIEKLVTSSLFYNSIQMKPKAGNRLVMDDKILRLNQMLFVGLVTGDYPVDWICTHFYFDIRGFYFLHRTNYYTEKAIQHLGGTPYKRFEQNQKQFNSVQSIGYKAMKAANAEVDQCLIDSVHHLVTSMKTPILIAIAGQTAAGKTEIVARLMAEFEQSGRKVTTIEIDHFLTDRDYREAHGIDSLGKEALHYEIFIQCLKDICQGKSITTPRYDFIQATSSHTLQGELKKGCTPMQIEPADIIFIEGNFPFLLPEVAHLISIKVVYMTDDANRMKRKWKRDMDYRKKYDLMYFINRYFREQFLMAESAYIPQMEICDMLVDTTDAAIWVTPAIKESLKTT